MWNLSTERERAAKRWLQWWHLARSTQLRDDALDEPPRVAREGKAHEPHGLFGRKIGLGILLRRRLVHRDRRRTVNLQLEDVRAARMAE